jgi:hypothetical protein
MVAAILIVVGVSKLLAPSWLRRAMMMEDNRHGPHFAAKPHCGGRSSQLFCGVLIIALGLLFLLDNLGMVESRSVLRLWPLLWSLPA